MQERRARLLRDDGVVEDEITFVGMGVPEVMRAIVALGRSRPDPERWTPQVEDGGEWRDVWRPE